MNNFAISSDGIATALQDSASALMEGGNNLEQAVALVAAANKVVQDPNSVGSALRTISLRLRGTSVEVLEEMGEETDGVVESVSKLQSKLKALTGVDIVDMNGAYKDTYTILRQIGAVWQDLDPMDQAAALELMAGKNRANTLAAILNNMEDLSGAYEYAMDADGSAARELDAYLDSIQGKIDQFNNTLQTFWSETLNSKVVKGIVDMGTDILKLVTNIGLIPTALAGVMFYFTAIKKNNPVTMFKDLSANMYNYGQALNQIKSIQSLNGANGTARMDTEAFNAQHIQAYGMAVQGLTQKQQVAALASAGLTKEQIAQAIGVRDLTDANFQAALAEAQVTAQKKNHITVSGALLLAKQKGVNITLSQKAQNFLLKNSEKEITDELIRQARVKGELSKRDVRDIKTKRALTQENMRQASSWNALTTSIKGMIAQNPVMFVTMLTTAVTGLISKLEDAIDKTEELTDTYNNLQSSISEIEGEISSLDSELSTIQDKIDELNKKSSLSITEAEQLDLLKQQSAEIERQKEFQESILATRKKQNQVHSSSMIDNLFATSAANQERTSDMWGKITGAVSAIGTVASLIAMWVGAVAEPTPGGEVAATAATPGLLTKIATVFKGAGATGKVTMLSGLSSVAYMAGDLAGSQIVSKAMAADSFTEWYEEYETAIDEAQEKADEAHNKYMSNMTDSNYEKWQKKVEQVNTLQTEMYNGLEELQGYIANLEYTDATAGIIDGYNELMVYLDSKNNTGDIDSQIVSVESLASEYYELSKGVDAYGNNVTLSSDEYKRYNQIVSQVLSYQSGLTKSYDAQGNAILRAASEQYNYNQLISTSIDLLKDAKKQGDIKAVSDDQIASTLKSAESTYTSSMDNLPDKLKVPSIKDYMSTTEQSWRDEYVISSIETAIGKTRGAWDVIFGKSEEFLVENINDVLSKRENITSVLFERMTKTYHVSEEVASQYVADYFKALDDIKAEKDAIVSTKEQTIKSVLSAVPKSHDDYEKLSGSQLEFINSYIDSFDGLSDKTLTDLINIKEHIKGIVGVITNTDNASLQTAIDDFMKLDPSSVSISAYENAFDDLWEEMADNGAQDKEALYQQLFPGDKQIDDMMTKVKEKVVDTSEGLLENLTFEELKIAYELVPELDSTDMTFAELREEIEKQLPKATGPIVQTYSTLVDQVEQFNDVVSQTSEIVLNNTQVTQEYKDSLIALGISEEELAQCFDATNGLVVTNASKLNMLIGKAQKNTAQNVQLARSQARLQYYELYKDMSKYIDAQGKVEEGKEDLIRGYYQEMNALEKTMARYTILEAKVLSAVDAYEKFQEAQQIDSEMDYIGGVEEMTLALGQAFNTGELGTETAQAAIAGLVPESVYKDLDTVDEKMAAIYDYFKNGKIAQYFDLSFDDDGNIESAEMKLGNLRKFIEDGLNGDYNGDGINVFEGTDWQHFELNQDWITSLPDGTDKLQAFADQMGVTKDVAFAFIKSLKDHDVEWLNGDYATFFDQLTTSTNEDKIQNYTQYLADYTAGLAECVSEQNELDEKLAAGTISQDEYDKAVAELTKKQSGYNEKIKEYNTLLADAKNASRISVFGVNAEGQVDYKLATTSDIEDTENIEDLDTWIERNLKVNQLHEEQTEAQEAYTQALAEYNAEAAQNNGVVSEDTIKNLKDAEKKVGDITSEIADAIVKRDELAKPTVLEIELAMEELDAQISTTSKNLDEKLSGGTYTVTVDGNEQSITTTEELLSTCFHQNEDGYWDIKPGVNKEQLETDFPEIFSYVDFLNSQITLKVVLDKQEAEVGLDDLITKIDEIIAAIDGLKISLDPESVAEVSRQLGELFKLDNIKLVVGSFWDGLTGGDSEANGSANVHGTAHAKGTAHKSGNWGLENSEHNSLVGELGPEMVNL